MFNRWKGDLCFSTNVLSSDPTQDTLFEPEAFGSSINTRIRYEDINKEVAGADIGNDYPHDVECFEPFKSHKAWIKEVVKLAEGQTSQTRNLSRQQEYVKFGDNKIADLVSMHVRKVRKP